MQDPLRSVAPVGVRGSVTGGLDALLVSRNATGLSGTLGSTSTDGGHALQELQMAQRQLAYPHRLSMYEQAPPVEVSMEEFETFALDRLQTLKALETAMLRNRSDADVKRVLKETFAAHLPFPSALAQRQGVDVDSDRRKDYISHFILRLAYCRSEDLRQWFVRHETMLFRQRWDMCTREERELFLGQSHFNFRPISPQEKEALATSLRSGTNVFNPNAMAMAAKAGAATPTFESEPFFKVPFEMVPDLVGHRDVYLQEGWAYVPQQCIVSVVMADFKQSLMTALHATAKALPRMDDDDRLKPVLNNMTNYYLGKDYANGEDGAVAGEISHADVDKLSAHFPPCMRHLHAQLRRDQHLKHNGRMQYGLFLKGIGLSLEEAMMFWRKAFGKINDDNFQRNYAYNIRHNYGQEGKRTNYTPYSCMKIITSNAPASGDNHGCPFKHFGRDNLQTMLTSYRLSPDGVKEVMDTLSAGPHYQIACTKFFECSRGRGSVGKSLASETETSGAAKAAITMDTISHPNQFFELSVKLAGGLDGASVIGKDANGNSDVSAARDTTSTGTTQEIEVAANVDGAVMDVDR